MNVDTTHTAITDVQKEKEENTKIKGTTWARNKYGWLVKIKEDGTISKNWKFEYRKKAWKHKKNRCETCGKGPKNLTVDHYPPLRETIETKQYTTLCKNCHHLLEEVRWLWEGGKPHDHN